MLISLAKKTEFCPDLTLRMRFERLARAILDTSMASKNFSFLSFNECNYLSRVSSIG